MRIHVIGTRGFPHIQGGVEKHCESLYLRIAGKGHLIKVFRRKPYLNAYNRLKKYPYLNFSDLYSPKNKNLETIIHSFAAATVCIFEKPDIVHIHNIGPALALPLLKWFGIKTVVTYHSANYEHSKWGMFAKKMLMMGERFVTLWADKTIFVSKAKFKSSKSLRKIHIPNGVACETPAKNHTFLDELNIQPEKYVLAVGRLTPEKGMKDLIVSFRAMTCDVNLIIAGDADHETGYSRDLRRMAEQDNRIILTGYITGEPLKQLFSHAKLFVLPSHNEGLPIVLLEALSFGLPVLASNISENLEVGLPEDQYFACGDVTDLKNKMRACMGIQHSKCEREKIRRKIADCYNWDKIAEQTQGVYDELMG